MTYSPHRDVVEGFGMLTSVSTSLQYCDGRVCGLVETFVDGRLSLLNHALGMEAKSNKGCASVICVLTFWPRLSFDSLLDSWPAYLSLWPRLVMFNFLFSSLYSGKNMLYS